MSWNLSTEREREREREKLVRSPIIKIHTITTIVVTTIKYTFTIEQVLMIVTAIFT